jgi:hypothetical protein
MANRRNNFYYGVEKVYSTMREIEATSWTAGTMKVRWRPFQSGARFATLHRSHFSDKSANSAKVIGRSKSRAEIAAAEHAGRFDGDALDIGDLLAFIF